MSRSIETLWGFALTGLLINYIQKIQYDTMMNQTKIDIELRKKYPFKPEKYKPVVNYDFSQVKYFTLFDYYIFNPHEYKYEVKNYDKN